MATRQDRERATKQNERHQAILAEMLNDDANKYCADCRSKGPRWASWNLGVFVCIRCAGIHRNLGVHISKMKSVNLDTWAPEQIECIRTKGNGVVNAMYEHGLPEGFRRPTDDSAVEAFIRSKYERKQYYNKKAERVEKVAPSSSTSSKDKMPKREAKKKTQAPKVAKTTVSAVPRPTSNTAIRASPGAQRAAPKSSPAPDLLSGLDAPSPAAAAAPAAQPTSSAQSANSDSGMGAFMGATSSPNPNADVFGAPAPAQNHQTDLFQSAGAPPVPAQAAVPQSNKASILSLYGQQQQQQMGNFGAPGGVAGSNGMSAGQMAYQQQVMMQQQMQQQMYMQQQLAMQQQQLTMQHQALQVNQVQEQMSRLRMGGGAPQNGQVGGWGQQPQQPQQPGQTMSNNLWN